MKCVIFLLVLLGHWSAGQELLGGWSTATDTSLIQDCLRRALVNIRGAQVNNDELSQATDVICKTQVVNGLNIRLTFALQKQRWQCTYYKSFITTLETQLEGCRELLEEPTIEQPKVVNPERVPEVQNDEQPLVVEKNNEEQEEKPNENGEEDDEAKIDALKERIVEENEHNDNQEEQPQ